MTQEEMMRKARKEAKEEMVRMRKDFEKNVLTRLQEWAYVAPTWSVLAVFMMMTAVTAGRDALEFVAGIVPLLSPIIDFFSGILSNFDEAPVLLPWAVTLIELVRRWRDWRARPDGWRELWQDWRKSWKRARHPILTYKKGRRWRRWQK